MQQLKHWDKEDWFIAGIFVGFILYALMNMGYNASM